MEHSRPCVVKTETLSYTWDVDLHKLRDVPATQDLIAKRGETSEEFGNAAAGFWKLQLFSCVAIQPKDTRLTLNVVYANKDKRIAECSAAILEKNGSEKQGTKKVLDLRLFTAASDTWGWDKFIDYQRHSILMPYYCVGPSTLRVKIILKVYFGFFEDESPPRSLIEIVQHSCRNNDEDIFDDDDNDNQSTVNSDKHPTSGGTPDASAASSPSLLSGSETTNDKHSPCCIVPGGSMQMDLSKFADDPRAFDMTIDCQGRKFSCNRFVLGARSEVFRAMLYGEFSESKQSEIGLHDISSDCVEEFLTFLMTDTCSLFKLPFRCRCGELKASTSAARGETETAISTRRVCSGNESCRYVRGKDALYLIPRLLDLLTAADKYQVLELSSKCSEALARCICYRTVLDILERAETLQCDSLIDACRYYIENSRHYTENSKGVDRGSESFCECLNKISVPLKIISGLGVGVVLMLTKTPLNTFSLPVKIISGLWMLKNVLSEVQLFTGRHQWRFCY